ncbi:1-phosphatidylinositol 4,5-bisphosphate phosphodiesterase gamma-1-like [Nilaparvata lugens]|uniref:1-phosphatidylinositol 4,5-bisphosphate phosphodiesterase gamma-1-like n=1 Tax=Nilaparvata lugens TaxID=108931 RepID=UPI00193D51EF|nr:1-phosphatidylinositol 4,5-bisphosphate phosphodiesterase gamma-1-like [Nilaparvata lugens]XP_039287691.1 1-phosphatidylinositol 4,5-bisphosphate phosphodiesterase gamma-1-like [Nilaparvata lugens]
MNMNMLNNSTMLMNIMPEVEQIISQLERGTLVTRYYPRKRPEKKTLMIRRETRQILWARTPNTKTFEGAVEMREVKEIRLGKCSKDFEKWPEEIKRIEQMRCFIVFYGSEFKLKSLSIVAFSEKECELWVRGLRHLVPDTINASYPLQVERWLRKEFYAMENSKEIVTLKDLKGFLPRINCKLSTNKLRELFQEVDTRKRNELGFDDFAELYHRLMFDEGTFRESVEDYCENGQNGIVSVQQLTNFLIKEQGEKRVEEKQVSSHMRDYLQDPQRNVEEPFFTAREFMDFLFSKQNELWDKAFDNIYQDMSRPLSHYWIASSHNTYLTGDQFSSESSVEAYVRCLRMGCRCIELDCWDGPDGKPIIYHGHTLTTRIKFLDVVKIIKEHAFVVSDFPVILSIEDNCSLPQQRNMAVTMQEVFGDMLLVQPVAKHETRLPSPYSLRHKIILKHKKLPEGGDEASVMMKPEQGKEMDLRNTVKNGILYLEDPVDKKWNPHFFFLTHHKLFYTDSFEGGPDADEGEDDEAEPQTFLKLKEGVPNDELHFGEKWFHGKLLGGRAEAEDLLRRYSHLGDGTFLVRESETFVGDYSLSFWRQGKVNHCRIRSKQDKGQIKFFLIDKNCFDSLYSLITHYRNHSLRSQEFLITLQEPVPQPNKHEGQPWYYPQASRSYAEELLKRVPLDGAFLVRPSLKDNNTFAISFRAERRMIKHCCIKREGRLYTIGTMQFESLVELINYYERHYLYRKVKLRIPITEELLNSTPMDSMDDGLASATPGYIDPSSFTSKITVKAIFDYQAKQDDELSFCKHAIITNVNKQDGGWWRGDYGGKRQHWFPSSYVEDVEPQQERDDSSGDSMLLGSLQKGSLDVMGAVVEIVEVSGGAVTGLEWVLRIQNPNRCTSFEVACQSRDQALEWMAAIERTAQSASFRENQNREMEKTWRVAKEISSLIIYCRSVAFNMERIKKKGFIYNEMSSFPETKAEKIMCQQESKFFYKYHQHQLSRVYPKGQRIDSSNYNPVPVWNAGCQMVALNYQTADKPMQINQCKFRLNGGCGYLLRPDAMFGADCDAPQAAATESIAIALRVIGARHLLRSGRGTASPFVEIEVLGADCDHGVKLTTKTVADNGLNPVWNDFCDFDVHKPELAMLRFVVQDEDMFGDKNFIGQATYPIVALRTGYRSVPLKNGFSEDIELSTLLVHLRIRTLSERRNEKSLRSNSTSSTVTLGSNSSSNRTHLQTVSLSSLSSDHSEFTFADSSC